MRMLRARLAISFILLSVAGTAFAQNVAAIALGRIASLSAGGPVSRLIVVDDRPVALGPESAWILGDDDVWRNGGWHPAASVLDAVEGAAATYLLLDSDRGVIVTRVTSPAPSSYGLDSEALPELPISLRSARGAILQDRLFVAGTTADGRPHLLSYDLLDELSSWVELEGEWPVTPVYVGSVAAQHSSLFITINDGKEDRSRMLQWSAAQGWVELEAPPARLTGVARSIGQAHVLYLVAAPPDTRLGPELLTFHAITGAWATLGRIDPAAVQSATGWRNGVLWIASPRDTKDTRLGFAQIESDKYGLDLVDWGVIALYLACVLGIGWYFYAQDSENSSVNYFLGGRTIPFWAAGVSIYASNVSTVSYIAIPAKSFATNWQYLMSPIIVVFGLMFAAIWIVPLLRRLELTSTFHYLESRFHPVIRTISSGLAIVYELGSRVAIILFLPSLAMSTVTGIDIIWSILLIGGVTICYTVLGGMKAVVWTDVLQLFVMFGGIFFAVAVVMQSLDGGVGEFFATAWSEDKMKLLDWRFDLTEATVWGFLLLVIFDTVLTFPKNQVMMQRVLSTSSVKQASRSVWTFAVIVIPGSVMFYAVGTALYVYYQNHPERMDPLLPVDATFPLFIAAELPVGVTGLIIAGIFAASMSTLSSTLNSISALVTVDFYEKVRKNCDSKRDLYFAECVTVIAGLLGIGLALFLSRFEITSVFDVSLQLMGLLGGGFAGAYTLGMFSRRSNWQGVLIGVVVSTISTIVAWSVSLLHSYFYLPFAIFVCIAVGYLASFPFPPPSTTHGLTIFRRDTLARHPSNGA